MSNRKSNEPSLSVLSFTLRHPEIWPKTFHGWGFSNCATCAMGLAQALWPQSIYEPSVSTMERVFELRGPAGPNIFCYRPNDITNISAEMVADRIDEYLKCH